MGPKRAPPGEQAPATPGEDSVIRRLTREDRARLSIDAWEPSLLRNLLKAQGRLRTERDTDDPPTPPEPRPQPKRRGRQKPL